MRYAFLTAVLAAALAGCSTPSNDAPPSLDHPANPDAATPAASQPVATKYQCPMHADQSADRPAACPACGMAMTPAPGAQDAHR